MTANQANGLKPKSLIAGKYNALEKKPFVMRKNCTFRM